MFDPLTILLVLGVLIVAFGFYVLFYRKKRLSAREMAKVRELWAEVSDLVEKHPEQAILKADKLLDFVLKSSGYKGSLGEKMKAARPVFRDNNGIWSAHKLRNCIAHEIDAKITSVQAKSALKAFKKALYDLGVNL